MPITPHANGESLLKRSSSYHILSRFAMILLVVWWSANGDSDSSALSSKASSNLLNDDTYQCICVGTCVIHSDK